MKAISHIIFFALCLSVLAACTLGLGLLVLLPILRGGSNREAKALEKLKSTLIKGEQLLFHGLQMRPFALQHRRQAIAATSSRIIQLSRNVFGGYDMKDYQWKDVVDVKLSENTIPAIAGSCLEFHLVPKTGSGPIVIDGIPSAVAASIYSHSQTEEQAWEEKRRIRELEEKRAASGGITLGATPRMAASHEGSGPSIADELEKAKKLLDSTAISDAEFEELKAKILSKHGGHV